MIKNIIFDLGNVLVKVDLEKFEKSVFPEGLKEKSYIRFLKSNKGYLTKNFRKVIFSYETGRINTTKFVDICLKNLKSGLSKRLFIKHFNEMLVEKPEMKRFIEELTKKTGYRFMLLSNTNSLHWQYVKKNFPYVMSLGTFELSYNLKLYKPDIRVYTTVIKKHKLIPLETLYVDDHEDNCLAARLLGINSILYKDFSSFKKEFKEYLKRR